MAISGLSLLLGAGVGVVAGVLIGCIGVGGVVLVPLLILREDVDVHLAVVACMAAYVPAGLAGAAAYVRKGAVPWRAATLMCLPAALAALLGAWTLARLSARAVKLVLYAVMLATSCLSAARSAHSEYRQRREDGEAAARQAGESPAAADGTAGEFPVDDDDDDDDDNRGDVAACSQDRDGGDGGCGAGTEVSDEQEPLVPGDGDGDVEGPQPGDGGASAVVDSSEKPSDEGNRCFGSMTGAELVQALLVGTLAGFGSALTGTSGPVLLLPMLFILLWPALPALGCAQLIQVPIACAATIGNVFFATTQVDLHDVLKLGGCVAAGLVPFVFVGAAIADHLPQRTLKIVIAILLVVASVTLLLKEVL